MISLVISLVVLGLVYWAVSFIPLPDPFPTIIKVLFIIIAVILLLNGFGVNTGLHLR